MKPRSTTNPKPKISPKSKINEKILNEIITEATEERYQKLSVYSRPLSIILRYLDITTPRFSKGGAANELLTAAVKKHYPDLWARLEGNVHETEPRTPLPENIDLSHENAWKQVVEETRTRAGKMINVFNPRTVSVLRYEDATTPRHNLTGRATELAEMAMAQWYPEAWKKAVASVPAEPRPTGARPKPETPKKEAQAAIKA